MARNSSDPEQNVFGISPLGGNSVEGTADGCASVRDTGTQGVPLVWDDRVKAFISEQAVEELNDQEVGRQAARDYERESQFREKAGYGRS